MTPEHMTPLFSTRKALAEKHGFSLSAQINALIFDVVDWAQRAQPATMFNGLTEAETDATASVFGLVGAQPASVPAGSRVVENRLLADLRDSMFDYKRGIAFGPVDAVALGKLDSLLAAAPQAPQPAQAVPEHLPTAEQIRELAQEALDQIMEQAQVFASAWSLVGGRFDSGNAMSDAEDAKAELRTMVRSLADLAAETLRPAAPQPAQATPAAVQAVISAMRSDPDYAWSWHCNVAMSFVDAGGDIYTANQGAARFMSMFAGVDPAYELPQTPQPAQAVPQLTGCNCRWDGETQVQWCELHLAHKEAIHDWAGRAKAAEAKLAAPQPEAQPTTNSYRKKPVVIEAIQWDGSWGSMEAIKAAFPAMEVCASTLHPPTKTVRGWSIRTLEGSHVVSVGDYIIKGVKGEFYPCKPDIFAMTYEPAAPSAQAEQKGGE